MVVMFSVAVVPTRFSQSYFNCGRRAAQPISSHSNCCFSSVTTICSRNILIFVPEEPIFKSLKTYLAIETNLNKV